MSKELDSGIAPDLSILIPDECNKPLAYYMVCGIKEAYPEAKIYVVGAANDKDSDWRLFMRLSKFFNQIYDSKYCFDEEGFHLDVLHLIELLDIDIIFPASELGFKYVSSQREAIGKLCRLPPLPSKVNLLTAFEKDRMGHFFMKKGIATPRTLSLEEFQAGAKIDFPILLKPIQGFGGYGILKFDTPEEVKIPEKRRVPFIAQEFVSGYDIGCNVICKDGEILNYTIQESLVKDLNIGPKYRLRFLHHQKVLDCVKEASRALNWTGVNNIDLIYNEKQDRVWIIEMNPRFWGSTLSTMQLDMNFPAMALKIAYGESIQTITYQEQVYIKHTEAFKDFLKGKKNYPWQQTSMRFFIADLKPTIERMLRTKFRISLVGKKKPMLVHRPEA